MPGGIFDGRSNLFTCYGVSLQLRNKLMGGIPRDPKIVSRWIASKAGVEDEEEIRRMTLRTMREMGMDVSVEASMEDIEKASELVAGLRQTNGFKIGERPGAGQQIYLESRALKAMLKEVTNILFAGERWGKRQGYPGKGPKGFLAERVYVLEDQLWLDRNEADGIELFVGHVTGPKGPSSNLTYYEYALRPTLDFTVMVAEDSIPDEAWPELWVLAQENGLGALRSQGHGRFDVTRFDVERAGRKYAVTRERIAAGQGNAPVEPVFGPA